MLKVGSSLPKDLVVRTEKDETVTVESLLGQPLALIFLRHLA